MIDQIKDSPKVVHGKRQIEAEADNHTSETEQKLLEMGKKKM